MKKFSFLIYHKDYDVFLQDLRDLGLIHVAQQAKDVEYDEELEELLSHLKKLQESKKIVERSMPDNEVPIPQSEADVELGYKVPQKVDEIQERIATVNQQLQVSTKELEALKPWGNFDPELIKKLKQAGYNIDFFSTQKSAYNPEWEEAYNAILINESIRYYFITVTQLPNVAEELGLEPSNLPDVSYEDLSNLIESVKVKLDKEQEALKALSAYMPALDAAIADIESKITLKRVVLNTNQVADDKLKLMQGWAPAENESRIAAYLQSKEAYYEISNPTPDDEVPIKFSNNKFFKLFEPITKLYMLPKYNELDLTPFFAPFFMLFFGLSLGDVGYGLFLFLGATIAKIWKGHAMKESMKSIFSLVQVLGASAFLSGFLSGGFFGIKLYEIDTPFAKTMEEIFFLDNYQMFSLSLILGVIQVLFGMILKVVNRVILFGMVHAVSSIGWVVLLLSFIVAAIFPAILPMTGSLHLIIIAICAIAVFFVNSPGKNIFLNLGLGLWETYNMATGLLGDILSYVRLFALGLSGGILANVFTSIATGMSPDNVILGPLVTILIFVIGHSINIFMNTLGAIVHPLRLTFVEFFKNAEFTGGGQKYQPFT